MQNYLHMVGSGLIGAQMDGPTNHDLSPSSSRKASYTVNEPSSRCVPARDKTDSHKNLRHREILSSADSTNHFITKTKVNGTVKN